MRTDPDSQISGGSGELHLGWLIPGHKICFGVGNAVRFQFTVEEAEHLYSVLGALLGYVGGDDDRDAESRVLDLCGCTSEDFAAAMAKGMDAGLDAQAAASQARQHVWDRLRDDFRSEDGRQA